MNLTKWKHSLMKSITAQHGNYVTHIPKWKDSLCYEYEILYHCNFHAI